jgi:bifunctional DNA primase/polymerase-like protein/AAA domain-containing protein/primase-like protein
MNLSDDALGASELSLSVDEPIDHLTFALDYALVHNWPVFPCRVREKRPATIHGFQDAETDPSLIKTWWSAESIADHLSPGVTPDPGLNVAVATGRKSRLVVVDIDPKNGGSLEALEARFGPMPETLRQATGGGGLQLFFYRPAEVERIPSSAGALLPGVDVRADGGYVVVPPSIHPSGRRYEWLKLDVPPAPLPDALLRAILGAKKIEPGIEAAAKFPRGQRNNSLARLAGGMRRAGMSVDEIRAALVVANERRCDPPLLPAELNAILCSAAKWEPGANRPSDADPIGPDDVKPFDQYAVAPVAYVVEKWLVEGTGESWCGESGTGKSSVATALGEAVSKGLPFAGLATVKRRVLLLDCGENPAAVMQHRLRVLKIEPSEGFIIWGEWVGELPSIPSVKIVEWIDACDPKPLIIVDCLSVFFTGKSENDSAEMRTFFKYLADWKSRGATYVLLHNRGKDKSVAYRGASAIKDACDVMRVITAEYDAKGLIQAVSFAQEKNRLIREESLPKEFALKFDPTGAFCLMCDPPKDDDRRLAELLKANPGTSARELEGYAREIGIKRATFRRFLGEGLHVGYVIEKRSGKRVGYRYAEPPEPELF